MNNKEAIEVLRKIDLCVPTGVIDPSDFYLALALAIKALEDRPQGDLISREALKKAIFTDFGLGDEENGSDAEYMSGLQDCYELIDNATTVEMPNWYKVYEDVKSTFERPKGEWIKSSDNMYFCSKCFFTKEQQMSNYCAFCGADMRGKKNEKTDK